MRSVASALFSEAASASSTSVPAKAPSDKLPEQDFDHLLKDRSRETPAPRRASSQRSKPAEKPVEQTKKKDDETSGDHETEATDDAAVKASADDQKEKHDQAEKKNEPDTTLLSSSLVMWQILPPTQPAPVVNGEIGSEPKEVSGEIEDLGKKGSGDVVAETPGQSPQPADKAADAAASGDSEAAKAPADAPAKATPETAAVDSNLPAVPSATATAIQTVPAHAPHGKTIVEARESKAERATRISAETPRSVVDGITVAKEQRAMTQPVSPLSGKTAPAAFAEGEKATSPKAATAEEKADARAETKASVEGISIESAAASSEGKVPDISSIGGLTAETKHTADVQVAETKTVAGSEATKLIEHIEKTVERMRTQGESRIELRMEMGGGEEVRIRLQMEQGQVKTTFRTDSDGLRQALEQSWSQFSQASAERSARVGTVVFESPAMQTGTGSFQQSPQQREQNASGQTSTAEFPTLGRRASAKPVAATSSTAVAGASKAASGLQIYA